MSKLGVSVAVMVLLVMAALVASFPYIAPNQAFRYSPSFNQVFVAYCRKAWDFDGGWRRIDARFPDANKRLREMWTDLRTTDEEKKSILDFAGYMTTEGFQEEEGMKIIILALKSSDHSIRADAILHLHYAPQAMSHQQKLDLLRREGIVLSEGELNSVLPGLRL